MDTDVLRIVVGCVMRLISQFGIQFASIGLVTVDRRIARRCPISNYPMMKQMSLDIWSGRNELLNEFHSAIQRRTHGRLSDLSLDVFHEGLVVEACATTYYTVQLALAAIKAFTADFPKLTPAKMSFHVNGHPLVLSNANAVGNGQAGRNDDLYGSSNAILPDPLRVEKSPSSLVSRSAVATAT